MRRIALPLIALLFVLVSGCKKEATVKVAIVANQQGFHFQFTPNIPVTITQIIGTKLGNAPLTAVGDGKTIYSEQKPFSIGPVTGLAIGQQWTFDIQGNVGAPQGPMFNVTTNFVAP